MLSLSSMAASGAHIPQNVSELPHYNTNERRGLPPDAAPIGVLANGDIYYSAYDMLTPNDISFLKKATGQSFDPATIAAEKAGGTFRGDPLAAAIGDARADSVMGLSDGLSGDVSASFLQSIECAISNPEGDGTYQGFRITQSELMAAFAALQSRLDTDIDISA
ncbi:MAG TPA: hypothetical protein VLT90_03585 [Terriglobales bacterium]|nr:hypothetical protein [Terriglobales bacterium]